jgi:hypothetical protein
VSPVFQEGAINAIVKKTERGELVGYDAFPTADDWLFKYTLDLVSTGESEYKSGNEAENRYLPDGA